MEETVESETSRTENWVNKGQSASRDANEGIKAEGSSKDDVNANPRELGAKTKRNKSSTRA